MLVTQKCQYALKALLELAKLSGRGPVKIAQIAEAQGIPFRFLEVILSQLKQGGFVESRRGTDGGYLLACRPGAVSVAEVIEFIDGAVWQIDDGNGAASREGVFGEMWREAAESLETVFRKRTIADLKERDEALHSRFVPNYQI
jgi:Rrf2 family protein